MSSTATAISAAVLGLLGGTAVGAAVSGWLGMRAKARSRVQKRREKLYADLLTWIGARLPHLEFQLQPNTGDAGTTVPDPAAILRIENTDPDTKFFIALRARVTVFASHDMARAFDNWTEAYRVTLKDPGQRGAAHKGATPGGKECQRDACQRCSLLALATRESTGHQATMREKWRKWAKREPITPLEAIQSAQYRKTISIRSKLLRQRDRIDGERGCLTRAVALCASAELRRG
jgi:hypothetical protein